jgi:hypothetical protein
VRPQSEVGDLAADVTFAVLACSGLEHRCRDWTLRRAITSKKICQMLLAPVSTLSANLVTVPGCSPAYSCCSAENAPLPAYSMQFTWCMIDQHQPCDLGAAVLRCACAGPASRAVTASRTLAQGSGCLSANAAMFCSRTCLMHRRELPTSAGLAFANVTHHLPTACWITMGGSPAAALCLLLKPAPCHCRPRRHTGVCLQDNKCCLRHHHPGSSEESILCSG